MNDAIINGYALIDSEDRSRTHPATWEHPPQAVLDQIRPRQFVKVGVTHADLPGERFWRVVKGRRASEIEIEIDQDLSESARHGLRDKDRLQVEPRHIFGLVDSDVTLWPRE